MARVFISHSSRDAQQAQDLFAWLKSQGFERGFLDIDTDHGIPPGAKWEQTLYEELERAQAVILLLTRNWFDSKWCFAEFAQARSRGKAIFPVIVSPDGDQYVGDDLQKVDLTKDRQTGLERLSNRLTEVALLSQSGFDFPPGRAPYPGFLAFDEDDAAIYFGRDDDVRRLIQRLDSRRIEGGRRFVVVLGESGTGKSSLLRAGLVPRVKRAKREWIVLPVFRPEHDPFAGLAACLRDAGISVTADELALADPEDLARRIGERHEAHRAGILIAIDQMEELFTRAPGSRSEQFLGFLSKLLGPGLPFVAAATLRSDHLGELQAAPGLATEFEEFSLRPLPIERMGEIVRGPARIAGLEVEESLVARIMQDARTTDALPLVAFALRRLYDQFGADGKLQLVEYESLRDAVAGLSPLETVVRDTAARVIDDIRPSEDELKVLREAFIPGLVKVNDEGGFVRQAANWDSLPQRGQRLITALAGSQARLLVVRERDGGREVEVAHEALFRVWPLLVGWLQEEKEFLIGHNRLERALADWRMLPKADCDRGLISGIMLDRARQWLIEHPGRFSDEEARYIRSSDAAEKKQLAEDEEQRRALEAAKLRQAEIERDSAKRLTRRTRLAAAVLGVVALVAVGAGVYAFRAEHRAAVEAERATAEAARANSEADRATAEAARATAEADKAKRNFEIAKSTVDKVIFDVVVGLRDVVGIRLQDMRTILGWVDDAMNNLAKASPDDTGVLRSREVMLHQFGDTYLVAGDTGQAVAIYEQALEIARKLAATDSTNTLWTRDLSVSLERVGNGRVAAGDRPGALAAYEESKAIRGKLAATDEKNEEWQRDISVGEQKIGDLRLDSGDIPGARAAFEQDLAITRRLANASPDNLNAQRDLSVSLEKVGNVRQSAGDSAGALAAYQESYEIRRRLAAANQANAMWRRDLSVSLEKIGNLKLSAGDNAGALAAYQDSLDIRRRVVASDQGNTEWQRDISVSLEKIGDIKFDAGDIAGAREAYDEDLAISENLAHTDEGNAGWQRDLSISLEKIGNVKEAEGDTQGALSAYEDSLRIRRRLAEADQGNGQWQRSLSVALEKVGNIRLNAGDRDGATAAYAEGLDIRRRLVASDGTNTEWQRDLSVSLEKLSDLKVDAGDLKGARAGSEETLEIRRKLAALDPGNTLWKSDLAIAWEKLGKVQDEESDTAGAGASYEESLKIRRALVASNPDNLDWQRDLSVGLEKTGDIKTNLQDYTGAAADFDECLAIRRRLVAASPDNTGWQRDLSVVLNRVGDTRRSLGDGAAAYADYQEGLVIVRKLAALDSGNTQWQTDLVVSLWKVQQASDRAAERRAALQEGLVILHKLDGQNRLTSTQKGWISTLQEALDGIS
jgi:tetratricopeptide (TPR) repeat protein